MADRRRTADLPEFGSADRYVGKVLGISPKPGERKPNRQTYYVDQTLHDRIKAIARENEVGLSDLVSHILERFVEDYQNGKFPIEPTVEVVKKKLSQDSG